MPENEVLDHSLYVALIDSMEAVCPAQIAIVVRTNPQQSHATWIIACLPTTDRHNIYPQPPNTPRRPQVRLHTILRPRLRMLVSMIFLLACFLFKIIILERRMHNIHTKMANSGIECQTRLLQKQLPFTIQIK